MKKKNFDVLYSTLPGSIVTTLCLDNGITSQRKMYSIFKHVESRVKSASKEKKYTPSELIEYIADLSGLDLTNRYKDYIALITRPPLTSIVSFVDIDRKVYPLRNDGVYTAAASREDFEVTEDLWG